jgi:hypothetical protein
MDIHIPSWLIAVLTHLVALVFGYFYRCLDEATNN